MATRNQVDLGLSGSTGTGNFVGANTPTLITPVIGAATGTSLNVSGNLTAGLGAGGSPGTLISFPTTTAKGRLVVAAVDNATGDFDTTISNAGAVAQGGRSGGRNGQPSDAQLLCEENDCRRDGALCARGCRCFARAGAALQ